MASAPPEQALPRATLADLRRLKAKPGEQTVGEAAADPDSSLNRWVRAFEARRNWTSARLASLPPDERRRVERMSCRAGDAYLRRLHRGDHDHHHGHRRDPGAKSVRRRGSQRCAPTRGDPDDGDPEPVGARPRACWQTAGAT